MAQVRIFVSHSSHDNAWSRPFADALKAVGYDVWYDETGLQGGAAWVASIQREVESRDVFLLVLTPEAWESKWVQDELQLAIATRRRILPVLLRNTQISGFLLTTQWISVISEEPRAAARAAVIAVEAPPAPGRGVAPQATSETLDDLKILCRSLATEGRYTESLSACQRALVLDKDSIEVLRIKAWVLNKIGELRLEGQVLFQILLLDPSNERLWSEEQGYPYYPYKRIWDALDNERDLLQAYVLLSSGSPYSYLNQSLLEDLLDRLNHINCLDAGMDVFLQIGDDAPKTRLRVCMRLGQMKRSDLAARLLDAWYGCPPKLTKVTDLPVLYDYAEILSDVGRRDDARDIHNLITHIFESAYNQALKFMDRRNYPWHSEEERVACTLYLRTLDKLGRAHDANRLRKTYPFL